MNKYDHNRDVLHFGMGSETRVGASKLEFFKRDAALARDGELSPTTGPVNATG